MVEALQKFLQELKALKAAVSKEGVFINKIGLRQSAESLSTNWFSTIAPELANHALIESKTLESYSGCFANLLKLSKPANRKTSWTAALICITKKFHDELILPIQMEPKVAQQVSQLTKLFADLASPEEDEYMKEAIACASHELYRGSAVLGWSAAIDRIHRVIEKIGFQKFNTTSQQMAAATVGQFKKYSVATHVSSISELREVFDTNILWILEGMKLVDGNQRIRLRSCYDLRCQCSHPGEAPVTEFNLLSFFSDINMIVFKNPKFALPEATTAAATPP